MNPSETTFVPGRLLLNGLRCTTPDTVPLWVDLGVTTDLGPAARSDDMADVVDIAELAATTREIIGSRPRALLESLAVDCAAALLARFQAVETVEVRITKRDPPGLDAAEEVVEVTLSR